MFDIIVCAFAIQKHPVQSVDHGIHHIALTADFAAPLFGNFQTAPDGTVSGVIQIGLYAADIRRDADTAIQVKYPAEHFWCTVK